MSTMAVIATGPIGMALVAAAEDANVDVTLCGVRPAERLMLELDGRARRIECRVVPDPEYATPVDWVLQTQPAVDRRWMSRLCQDSTAVVGIGTWAGRRRPRPTGNGHRYVPAIAHIDAEQIAPGYVVHRSGRELALPAGSVARDLAAVFAPSWLQVCEEADFLTASWKNLLDRVASEPISAIACRRMGIMRDPHVRTLATRLLTEAVAVGIAEGARLTTEDVDAALAAFEHFQEFDGTTMLSDRFAGRPLDFEAATGMIVRLGRVHGIPTQVNQGIYALLGAISPQQTDHRQEDDGDRDTSEELSYIPRASRRPWDGAGST
ncbi:ketopantoate reductase family protein [Fodinicola acaciae]|uniref:ketopantoate reductase family protein n=1 Tax=Fodinicola acaciae TaxID=2681555 RepID=UPI001FE6AB7C|nr:ketopantoate reductase C-terminal domain-containing protein [Fodinicola acaciae]